MIVPSSATSRTEISLIFPVCYFFVVEVLAFLLWGTNISVGGGSSCLVLDLVDLDFPIFASVCILSWDVNRVAMFSKQSSMVVVRESSFVSEGNTDGRIVPACRSLFVDVYHTSGVVVRDPLFALHWVVLEPIDIFWPIINEGYPVFQWSRFLQTITQIASIPCVYCWQASMKSTPMTSQGVKEQEAEHLNSGCY